MADEAIGNLREMISRHRSERTAAANDLFFLLGSAVVDKCRELNIPLPSDVQFADTRMFRLQRNAVAHEVPRLRSALLSVIGSIKPEYENSALILLTRSGQLMEMEQQRQAQELERITQRFHSGAEKIEDWRAKGRR